MNKNLHFLSIIKSTTINNSGHLLKHLVTFKKRGYIFYTPFRPCYEYREFLYDTFYFNDEMPQGKVEKRAGDREKVILVMGTRDPMGAILPQNNNSAENRDNIHQSSWLLCLRQMCHLIQSLHLMSRNISQLHYSSSSCIWSGNYNYIGVKLPFSIRLKLWTPFKGGGEGRVEGVKWKNNWTHSFKGR